MGMEVYTVKVKRHDAATLPSERRYSARAAAGLAWVHAALAATAALLAGLAVRARLAEHTGLNHTDYNYTDNYTDNNNYTLIDDQERFGAWSWVEVGAPAAVSGGAALAGAAAALACVRWYRARSVAWLLAASLLSTVLSLAAFVAVAVRSAGQGDLADFYRDKVPFTELVAVPRAALVGGNHSHVLVRVAGPGGGGGGGGRVLSVNVLLAACLEALWSLLSACLAYRGVRAPPPRLAPPLPRAPPVPPRERKLDSAETYKDRMLRVLEPSSQSLHSIPEQTPPVEQPPAVHLAPPSWGDSPAHRVYTQDTLDLDDIFIFKHTDNTTLR